MARQRKTLPARRRDALDDSLLIRSAESLGRVIGSLQRQLDAARHVVSAQGRAKARVDGRGNGHAPVRERNVKMNSAAKAKTVVGRKAPSRLAAGKQSSTKRRSPKPR